MVAEPWATIAGGRAVLPADVRHLHLFDGRRLGADLGIAVVARMPAAADGGGDRLVVRTAAEETAQVVAGACEEAEIELAVGREAGARATAAERLGDRRDDSDRKSVV